MGVKRDYFADRGIELTEEDNGRFKQTRNERDKHRFKVPGLRNIALTAPYFHERQYENNERGCRLHGQISDGSESSGR